MTIFLKIWGEGPFGPPGYAYALIWGLYVCYVGLDIPKFGTNPDL